MRKMVFVSFCLAGILWGAEGSGVIDCNVIFEQRKAEILREIEKIDEQQQSLQALQQATQSVLDQKDADLKKREAILNEEKKAIEQKEADIQALLKKNEKILKEIKEATQSKLGETYAGMKDSKSSAILENLPEIEAARILFSLDTKVVSKILAKMNPQKAASLTQIIQKGPPFETQEILQTDMQNNSQNIPANADSNPTNSM